MIRPEMMWPVEDAYKPMYSRYCEFGQDVAGRSRLAVLAIARNAMPHLPNTLALLDETAKHFTGTSVYVYENDSTDTTAAVLDEFAASRPSVVVEHDTFGEPDTRGFEGGRTVRLARCRNRCLAWLAANAANCAHTLVLDLDPHGGFSPDGILNSIGWIAEYAGSNWSSAAVGGMAAFSLYCRRDDGGNVGIAHYDAWAMRLNWWEDRREKAGGMMWAHYLMPPVGSTPIPMNSAFGGACVYRTEALLAGKYDGVGVDGNEDCEHVALHRSMKAAGYQMYLNPGCRYIAVLPEDFLQ